MNCLREFSGLPVENLAPGQSPRNDSCIEDLHQCKDYNRRKPSVRKLFEPLSRKRHEKDAAAEAAAKVAVDATMPIRELTQNALITRNHLELHYTNLLTLDSLHILYTQQYFVQKILSTLQQLFHADRKDIWQLIETLCTMEPVMMTETGWLAGGGLIQNLKVNFTQPCRIMFGVLKQQLMETVFLIHTVVPRYSGLCYNGLFE